MAEYGIGEGEIIVPDNPYVPQVNVRIQKKSVDTPKGDEEEEQSEEDTEEEGGANTSGSFKDSDYINLSSADNNYIIEFGSTVTSTNTDSDSERTEEVTISIVDRTGALIDSMLGQLSTTSVIKYSYGYAGGVMSPELEANLAGYGSTITPQGERIDIQLTVAGSESSDASGSNSTKAYTGNPSDIVKEIAAEEGWELGLIEETVPQTESSTVQVAYSENQARAQSYASELQERLKNPTAWIDKKAKENKDAKKNNKNVKDLLPQNLLK